MDKSMEHGWLCRNCNTLVSSDIDRCPKCGAESPNGESCEALPEGISEVVEMKNYANATPKVKAKYIFREAVLANSGDIILVFGLFCTFGALIAPMFMHEVDNIRLITLCVAVVLFATTMISWAILRTLAEISRMLRSREEQEQSGFTHHTEP